MEKVEPNDNEACLVKRVREGDERAMKAVYARYARYLSALCFRYITTDEDVKDVLQDAFLKIFSSMGAFEYRGKGSLKAWMAKIVLNETLKFVRQNSRMDFLETSHALPDLPEDEPHSEGVPASVIYQLIRELPEGYRMIFNLYVVEGKSHKEIASLLGIKESSSASQLHRAKALLAGKINRYNQLKSLSEWTKNG